MSISGGTKYGPSLASLRSLITGSPLIIIGSRSQGIETKLRPVADGMPSLPNEPKSPEPSRATLKLRTVDAMLMPPKIKDQKLEIA